MKKIGILFGQENTFPQAFIDRVNEKKETGIVAEAVSIDMVQQGHPTEYAVIIDRISQDVPFYRAYLKNAAIGGTAVINNPFWWSADEKFFNNALALKAGVEVPKTVLLPSHARPNDTDENSFRNLKFPHNWDAIFEYIGFPAYMKPHAGGGWKSVYRVENPDDLFAKHAETDQLVMMLQEEIVFTEYFRCYCLGGDNVHIMQYEPRNPHHLRYVRNAPPVQKALLDKVRDGVIRLNKALGYDFNTVEFAIRDGIPYAIDFCNPAPDADIHSVGQDNFDWIVENSANLAIARAKAHKPGQMNLTWGTFISDQLAMPAARRTTRSTAKKPAARKTTASASSKVTVKKTSKAAPKRMMEKPSSSAAPKKAAPAKKASTSAAKATPAKKASSSTATKATPAKKASSATKATPQKKTSSKKAAPRSSKK
jgi:glutathione synthase/RimK-type ligase-like ATP-grasp enzyme